MSTNNKIYVRISVDFVVTVEEAEKIPSKYISLLDKQGEELTSGELYQIGYEDENGDECNENGEKL